MAKKTLIVIEGLDGSGKSTQLQMLKEKLPGAHFITFPCYEAYSGRIISEYLSGAYNEQNSKVSAYSASIMYAQDRYISYKTDWQKIYESGVPVISARYVSSNAVYQMTKLERGDWDGYLEWLCDLEYDKLALPRPDATVYLDMPTDISQRLLSSRYSGDESKKDIHEKDTAFLEKCARAARYASERFGWISIPCSRDNEPAPPEIINKKITDILEEYGIKTG